MAHGGFGTVGDPTVPVESAVVTRRFYVRTFGCQMNEHDSERIAGLLAEEGMEATDDLESADVVVLNTCCIRENADNKLYGHLGHLKSLKDRRPDLQIAVGGCLAQKDRDLIVERAGHVDVVFGTHNLAHAPALLAESSRTGAPVVEILEEHEAYPSALPARREVDHSAWVTIQIGCDNSCAFCIVPAVRGAEISRPFADVVAEVTRLADEGVSEITLLGQNVNSYGHDLDPESRFAHIHTARTVGRRQDREGRPDLAELIRAIDGLRTADGAPAIPRLRFVTSHPWDLSDRLIAAMADCPSMCEALHLPVQSGSDTMLRRMGRQYTIEHYIERLGRIREAVPGLALSTDVIVGFCGETEAEYEATLRLLETVRYDQVFAAAYSERPGTPATRLADDVPAVEKRRRLVDLLALQEDIGLERNWAWAGRSTEVLIDAVVPPRSHEHDDEEAAGTTESRDAFAHLPDGVAHLTGRSRENKLVHVAGSPDLIGRLVDVRIEHAGPYALRGVLA
jgi:tRNA-2-methylthio-N6-dimethylallyladenosine synthase